ncbi:MAG: MFS transporter, partial [Armatimonadota bacterium]
NKRRMLIVVESLSAVPPLVLAYLVWTDTWLIWPVVAALSFVGGVCHAFEMPTRHSFIIDMVGRKDLMNAIALNSTLFSSARVLGPAAAGYIIDAFASTAPCFLITGLGFSAIIIALALTRVQERGPAEPQRLAASFVDGFRYARSRRIVFGTLAVLVMLMLFAASYSVLLPVFAKDVFDRGPRGLGLLTTAAGVGAVIGALTVASLLSTIRKPVPLLFAGIIAYGAGLFCFSFMDRFSGGMALLVLVGWASMWCTPTANSILQTSVPDEVRGRIMGLYAMCVAGMRPLGSITVGALAQWLGAQATVRIGACVCGACGVVLLLVGWRRGWLARELEPAETLERPALDALPSAAESIPRGK